jgi:hypothetical protein
VPTEGELNAEILLASTSVTNTATALSFLKLPAAGGLNGVKHTPNNVGSEVYLWTKTDGVAPAEGVSLDIDPSSNSSNSSNFSDRSKDDHLPVRCIQTEEPILFNGVSYNMITSPNTGRIWLDRNLGATFIQAFTLSEPYISALVQSKDDAVTVTKFPSVEVMPPSFVSVVPECLN